MPFRSVDDVWDEIVATLELGSGLRFVVTETNDESGANELRKRLVKWLRERGQTLAAPLDGENVLDWLNKQQRKSIQKGLPDVVRWLPLPEGYDGKFILHRLNEGRDNLRRNLRGVLFLVDGPGFVPRIANEAPDLWSVREKVLEIEALGLKAPMSKRLRKPKSTAPPAVNYPYDVFLSYSSREAEAAKHIRRRLEHDGIKVRSTDDIIRRALTDHDFRALTLQCRFLVPLLSPGYTRSFWTMRAFEIFLQREPRALNTSVIPVMIQDTIVPGLLRELSYFNGRTPKSWDAAYPKLLRILKEARTT